jgi:hypothetical protein
MASVIGTPEQFQVISQKITVKFDDLIRQALKRGQSMISYADYKLNSPKRFQELHQVLGDLEKAMSEPYQFSVFAADRISRSVNFGLVTTYRQEWVPKNYQVGELVKTVPLAPKEVRRLPRKWQYTKAGLRSKSTIISRLSRPTVRRHLMLRARLSKRRKRRLISKALRRGASMLRSQMRKLPPPSGGFRPVPGSRSNTCRAASSFVSRLAVSI